MTFWRWERMVRDLEQSCGCPRARVGWLHKLYLLGLSPGQVFERVHRLPLLALLGADGSPESN